MLFPPRSECSRMGQCSAALDYHAPGGEVNGLYSTWKPVTSVLGPVLFNVIVNGMEEVTGYTFIKLADSTKLCVCVCDQSIWGRARLPFRVT